MNLRYILMYIGLEYVIASPKKVLSSFVPYCKNFGRLKFRTLKNFGRFYFRTLFLFEIKIVRNFLQVMYPIFSEVNIYHSHFRRKLSIVNLGARFLRHVT